jgi:energy-coupling factor transporter transmembrane protein EcfT
VSKGHILKVNDTNPLVPVGLAFGGLLAASLARDNLALGLVWLAFNALTWMLHFDLQQVYRNVRQMIPWTSIFFTIHLLFSVATNSTLSVVDVLNREAIVFFRFLALAGVMGVVLNGVGVQRFIDSLKTILDRLGVHSHFGEDMLQILRLILTFIPQVSREYAGLMEFNRAVGFEEPTSFFQRMRFYGSNLLPVVSRSLDQAYQVGGTMVLRGYGRVVPRGQLTPVPFVVADALKLCGIALVFGILVWTT